MSLVVVVFVLVYAGMAAGRLPGTAIDRTGFAVIAAAGLWLSGEVGGDALVASVDFPTLIVLLSLMLLSAQFELAGFYGRLAWRLAGAQCSGLTLLGLTTLACGALAAIFTNDVVVFALTPMLCRGLAERRLDPRPFVIAVACAANIGLAATLIGNPQNVLIAQVGGLDFWDYAVVAAPLALCGLLVVVGVVGAVWHKTLLGTASGLGGRPSGPLIVPAPALDRSRLTKGMIAAGLLLALLAVGASQLSAALAAGAFLLTSRQLPTRHLLAGVDWPLLCLFTGLFVVTGAFAQTPWPAESLSFLAGLGLHPTDPGALAAISLAGSNTIGNVPLVLLLLTILPAPDADSLYALALLSTLAGNLLVTGSLANIIALERATSAGVRVTFRDHAVCGVPVTLLTVAAAVGWLRLV